MHFLHIDPLEPLPATSPTGSPPRAERLFVASHAIGSVCVVDPTALQEVARIAVGGHPQAMALDSVHSKLYVAMGQTLHSIDTATAQTLAALPSLDGGDWGPPVVRQTSAGARVFAYAGAGLAVHVDGASGEVLCTLAVPPGGGEVAPNPDGSVQYYLGGLALAKAEGQSVTQTMDLARYAPVHHVAYDPVGDTVLLATDNGIVVLRGSNMGFVLRLHAGVPYGAMAVDAETNSVLVAVRAQTDFADVFSLLNGKLLDSIALPPGLHAQVAVGSGGKVYVPTQDFVHGGKLTVWDPTGGGSLQSMDTLGSSPLGVAVGTVCVPESAAQASPQQEPNRNAKRDVGQVELLAAKQAIGGALEAGAFAFFVKDEEGNTLAATHNDAQGRVVFPAMELEPGVHSLTLEEEPAASQAGEWVLDREPKDVVVRVAPAPDGATQSSVVYPNGTPVFKNRRKSDSCGLVEFEELTFDAPGRYEFVVAELEQAAPGWALDDTVYRVIVHVDEDGSGNLVASVEYPDGYPNFVNVYLGAAVPAQAVISACKLAVGAPLEAGMFRFGLFEANKTEEPPLAVASNLGAPETLVENKQEFLAMARAYAQQQNRCQAQAATGAEGATGQAPAVPAQNADAGATMEAMERCVAAANQRLQSMHRWLRSCGGAL